MAAVPEGTVTQWAFNAPDAAIRSVQATVEYEPGYVRASKTVRGRWLMRLYQDIRGNKIEATAPVEVLDPAHDPIDLGKPTKRLQVGFPVFAEIVYSARDGTEPLFWQGAIRVNYTINLE